MSTSEWDLIQQCRRGRSAAFAPLVAGHQRDALVLAESLLLDPDDAADAVQEAFVRAYANLGRLAQGSAFGPWFRAIVRNRCLDLLRSPARRGREPIETVVDEPRVEATGTARLERQQVSESIRAALGRLPAAHREVLVLKEIEGLGYAEIAKALGVAEGTVASRLYHARAALKRALMDVGINSREGA